MSDILHMSKKELSRTQVIRQLDEGHIKQHHAAEQLNVSIRQIKRLLKAYRRFGNQGLLSKKRGRPSHHQLDPQVKHDALELLQARYADFGPTFAHEKLTEVHHLDLGRETVRGLMIHADLWHPRRAHKPVIHPLRERRARLGELVQIDGSPFAWFEDRAPACTLLVFVDDATGRLLELFFTEAESTFSYFEAAEHYFKRYGKPLAFYCDKLGVFRINQPKALLGSGLTQFGRAMDQLDIEVICANTPQAKGRVERANQTLQNRLPKEMRLRGISTMAEGNGYLPEFIADLDARFAAVPRDPEDAHRPLLPKDNLARILTVQETRVLSKNLTLQYDNVVYQIKTPRPTYALRNAQVLVCENRQGEIAIEYKGKPLTYTVYRQSPHQAEVVASKQIAMKLDGLTAPAKSAKKRKPSIPPSDHPWRQFQIGTKPSQPSQPK
ncbi:MAG: ISNCY family transposase [Chloroflexi bacterium]|nr:ISNCY family transposase [Chloroflexota bacterium]